MRQKLISYLLDDIMPEVRRTRQPEASILKFASAKNLNAAQVELLGQLYNTAKTLTYLDKSANRGGTFKIIDVPEMVADFLKVDAKEAATMQPVINSGSLEDCFDPRVKSAAAEESFVRTGSLLDPDKVVHQANDALQKNLEWGRQAMYEYSENVNAKMAGIALHLRQYDDSFPALESDALYFYGDDAKPMLEKLATYLKEDRIQVQRADGPGGHRVIDDSSPLFEKLAGLHREWEMWSVARDFVKEASAEVQLETKKKLVPASNSPRPSGGSGTPAFKPSGGGGGMGGGGDGKQKRPSTFGGFMNKGLDIAAAPVLDKYLGHAEKAFSGINNRAQKTVDTSARDARHMAVLQNLLTTDEILAEADPEKLTEIFNMLRENAPHLAGDVNTARVILRSAAQHDGVSPFDLKGFLDAERAKQQVDVGQRQLGGHLYRGKDLAGK